MCESADHGSAAALPRFPPEGQDGRDHFCYSTIGSEPDSWGLLPLTLHMRVFIEAPSTYTDRLTVDRDRNLNPLTDSRGRRTTRTESTTYTCASMPESAKRNFFNAFQASVDHIWNEKLWLGTRRRTRRGIRGLRCHVELERVTNASQAHVRVCVLYRYNPPANCHPDTRQFRAFCDRLGGTQNPSRADIVIDYPAPGGTESGQAGDFDTTRMLPTSNHGDEVTFRQNTVGHEFGHYLGLAHTCAGEGRANGDAEYCDGRSRGRQRHIMAVGNAVHRGHARPWLNRLPRHHHSCELAWRPHTNRERPPR
jgi:hypothetical protein